MVEGGFCSGTQYEDKLQEKEGQHQMLQQLLGRPWLSSDDSFCYTDSLWSAPLHSTDAVQTARAEASTYHVLA